MVTEFLSSQPVDLNWFCHYYTSDKLKDLMESECGVSLYSGFPSLPYAIHTAIYAYCKYCLLWENCHCVGNSMTEDDECEAQDPDDYEKMQASDHDESGEENELCSVAEEEHEE